VIRRLFLAAFAAALSAPNPFAAGARAEQAAGDAHRFAFDNIDGGEIRLADFRGRPVMVVNTASKCGFTYQYDALQKLWTDYRDRGLVVVGVPSDDFGGQEYASEAEVKNFCTMNFGIDFPMTTITKVKGSGRHPFYAWAAEALGENQTPRWNFHKYLVDGEGRLVAAFGTGVEPNSAAVTSAVEKLLPAG
jgi:glutathione peroxidase